MKGNCILFNSRDELVRLETSKIVYFEANGNYTSVVSVNKLHATIGMNLSAVEKFLHDKVDADVGLFLRIGKRFIVNMHYVYRVSTAKQQLILTDFNLFAIQITISKEALRKVKDLLAQINQNNNRDGNNNR